jgi:Acetyltransferase (isoleucine patch superfamily)
MEFTQNLLLQEHFPSIELRIGAYTYGKPRILCEKVDSRRILEIGRYCSIAENVKIFVGRHGRHATEFASSYPMGLVFNNRNHSKPHKAARGPLDVIIGSDVWIGRDSTIMAGVNIGHGAVIGSTAVVTKSVPPYAIVGGVPAKMIRSRFAPDIIELMLETRWWELDPSQLEEIAPFFYTEDLRKFADAVRMLRSQERFNA